MPSLRKTKILNFDFPSRAYILDAGSRLILLKSLWYGCKRNFIDGSNRLGGEINNVTVEKRFSGERCLPRSLGDNDFMQAFRWCQHYFRKCSHFDAVHFFVKVANGKKMSFSYGIILS
jgi:hypothetical protein